MYYVAIEPPSNMAKETAIEEWELDKVYPEFKTDLEKTAIWATLKL